MSNYAGPLADSGERVEFAGGGVRDPETGKPRFDLLLPEGIPFEEQILTRFANHMAKGAEKYSQRNWELMVDDAALGRAKSSALRHMLQWITGDDSEPGADHAASILFNIMAAETIAYKIRGRDESPQPEPLLPETDLTEFLAEIDESVQRLARAHRGRVQA